MASTNFLVFDEGKQNMMSDGDYSANTQRARGVTPGIAYPNLHNKLYYQVSVMAKAIADFIVAQGANASDEDVEQLTADISTAFTNFVDNKTKDMYLPLSGGTMKGLVNLFTGSTIPTPAENDNSIKIANTQWVREYIDNFLVGNIIYRPFLENGYVKLNGATVQREDYPRLVQYAIDNSLFTANNANTPWLFGNGDGKTTFVLPDYRNVFVEGGDTPSKKVAGLPNITGQFGTDGNIIIFDKHSGCFTKSGISGTITFSNNANISSGDRGVNFNAGLSNSIYGKSTTVQPPSIVLIPQIKY